MQFADLECEWAQVLRGLEAFQQVEATSFQVFVQPYVLTAGGPGVSTTTVVYYLYNNGFQYFKMGYASAVGWVLFAVVMAATALQFGFRNTLSKESQFPDLAAARTDTAVAQKIRQTNRA